MKKYSSQLIKLCAKHDAGKIYCPENSKLGKILYKETDFLIGKLKLAERLWYIKNNVHEQIRCPVCNNLSKINLKLNRPACCSTYCASKYIDDSGLTVNERRIVSSKLTKSKINPKTGLTRAQEVANKSAITMKRINQETGLSIYQIAQNKQVITKSKINPKTGLTRAQEIGLKSKDTKSKINPETGLTRSQEIAIVLKKTLKKINPETGLTLVQERNDKINKSIKIKNYNNLKIIFPKEYKLLTNKNEYIKNKRFLKYQHECGEIRESYWPYIRCTKCYPYNKSIAENEILEFCQSLSSKVQSNTRQIICPLELDVYIPDYNLAIEYNGLFWHSYDSINIENKDYHLIKTKLCKNLNIQLLHIFENEWEDLQKRKIWKSIIRNKLGQSSKIFARKCKIKEVSPKNSKIFLNNNHLQGQCNSSINIGLYYEDELVSIMVFGKSRFNKKIDWELLRFCNKLNYSVVGAASRLFKNFLKEHAGSVISYADMRYSDGELYRNLGFEFKHKSSPNYFYWKLGQNYLESRIKYQKHKLKNKLEEFDENLTESENMYNNGYRKIFDCGNQVWVY